MAAQRKRNTGRRSRDEERRFTVRGVRRDPVDIGKLSKALLGLALAEAEREAQAEHAARHMKSGIVSDGDEQSGGEHDG